jgi:predicted O-linked N-acetylglucosamine transferase (SPINDLY family)
MAFKAGAPVLATLARFLAAEVTSMAALRTRREADQATLQQCLMLLQQRRLADAERLLEQITKRSPHDHDALHLLGIIAHETRRPLRAVALIAKALRLKPNFATAYDSLANALNDLGRRDEALANCEKAIALDPRFAEAYVNRGNILHALQRFDAALASYDQALAIAPGFAEAHFNRGTALGAAGRQEEALASCDKAIALRPDLTEAHFNRGNILVHLQRDSEALASFSKVIALKPDHAEAHYNLGNVLSTLRRHEEAVASYDRTIIMRPSHADAHHNRGLALYYLGRFEDALVSHEKAIALEPDLEFLLGNLIQLKLILCDWSGLDKRIEQLARKIERDEKACQPFTALSVLRSPLLQQRATAVYAQCKHPPDCRLSRIARYPRHDKIRIGYFSADFREHAVASLMVKLFENHNRSRFYVVGFAFGPTSNDTMTTRVAGALDEFIDVRGLSDESVARLAREHEIDIAVDLGGYTTHSRTGIFALRAAPIQVNYIGYLGTMAVDYIDYIIADTILIPESERRFYSEKVAYIPSFQSNDAERQFSDRPLTRTDLGLPEQGFVFCCFNNNFKILPDVFNSCGRIVNSTAGSVIWLHAANEVAIKNLRAAAARIGIDRERIIIARPVERPEYLARLRLADLFLDTLPYNAGTTASDALWTGLPVLTRIGETFAGRVGASLLTAIGLPELITSSPFEYENMAIQLAHNHDQLNSIRRKLADNRLATPLFDTEQFAAHIEAAYTSMYERWQADLPPDHIQSAARQTALPHRDAHGQVMR